MFYEISILPSTVDDSDVKATQVDPSILIMQKYNGKATDALLRLRQVPRMLKQYVCTRCSSCSLLVDFCLVRQSTPTRYGVDVVSLKNVQTRALSITGLRLIVCAATCSWAL